MGTILEVCLGPHCRFNFIWCSNPRPSAFITDYFCPDFVYDCASCLFWLPVLLIPCAHLTTSLASVLPVLVSYADLCLASFCNLMLHLDPSLLQSSAHLTWPTDSWLRRTLLALRGPSVSWKLSLPLSFVYHLEVIGLCEIFIINFKYFQFLLIIFTEHCISFGIFLFCFGLTSCMVRLILPSLFSHQCFVRRNNY